MPITFTWEVLDCMQVKTIWRLHYVFWCSRTQVIYLYLCSADERVPYTVTPSSFPVTLRVFKSTALLNYYISVSLLPTMYCLPRQLPAFLDDFRIPFTVFLAFLGGIVMFFFVELNSKSMLIISVWKYLSFGFFHCLTSNEFHLHSTSATLPGHTSSLGKPDLRFLDRVWPPIPVLSPYWNLPVHHEYLIKIAHPSARRASELGCSLDGS